MEDKIFEERLNAIKSRERNMIEDHGFFVRYVYETEASEFDGLANIYTQGLPRSFNHPDIQVVLPIPQLVIHSVLVGVVNAIKSGIVFEDGVISHEVLAGMPVTFKPFDNGGVSMLRMLLPDPNGVLPTDDSCSESYKRQLEVLPE